MKKIVVFGLIGILFSSISWAGINITPEPLPTLTKAEIDTIIIRPFTQQAQVTIRKGFEDGGNFVGVGGKEINILFLNRLDDPRTSADETSTDYTDFMNAIKINMAEVEKQVEGKL